MIGLRVHMEQVHKEQLEAVDNAIPGRESIELEIFGTEGIPESEVAAHNQRILAVIAQREADRRAASGQSGSGSKKPKLDISQELDPENIKKKLEAHKKAMAASQNSGSTGGTPVPPGNMSPGRSASPGQAAFDGQKSPAQAGFVGYFPFHHHVGFPSLLFFFLWIFAGLLTDFLVFSLKLRVPHSNRAVTPCPNNLLGHTPLLKRILHRISLLTVPHTMHHHSSSRRRLLVVGLPQPVRDTMVSNRLRIKGLVQATIPTRIINSNSPLRLIFHALPPRHRYHNPTKFLASHPGLVLLDCRLGRTLITLL